MENVLEWLEATAKRLPEKIAFTSETEEGQDIEVTFKEVYDKARMIGSSIIKPNDTIHL